MCIVLSHQLSCLVKSIVLSSFFFLYDHNFIMTLFLELYKYKLHFLTPFYYFTCYLATHIFFLLSWICYWSALPSFLNLQQDKLICHINKYSVYSACWTLPPLFVYLFMIIWITLAIQVTKTSIFSPAQHDLRLPAQLNSAKSSIFSITSSSGHVEPTWFNYANHLNFVWPAMDPIQRRNIVT
jgi:hypothetical protein